MGRWLIGTDYTKFNDPALDRPPTGASDAATKLIWTDGCSWTQCPEQALDWIGYNNYGMEVLKYPITISVFRTGALRAEPCDQSRAPTWAPGSRSPSRSSGHAS
jgi:hypothetical protein